MKKVYSKILEKALLYYEKGRPRDIEHIKWLVETIPKFIDKSEVDFDILMPVVILHDVGYSKVEKGTDFFKLDIRKFHSEEGAKIAGKILNELGYPQDKIKEIKRLICKHDNWAFGDSFEDEPILRIFNNFDFMWVVSQIGFKVYASFLKANPEETIRNIEESEKTNIKDGRKWFNKKIENYYKELMEERKREI